MTSAGGPAAERVVFVRCGGHRGTGYLLTPELVLTAAHLVSGSDDSEIRVMVPGERSEHVGARPSEAEDARGDGERSSGMLTEWSCLRAGVWFRPSAGQDVALLDIQRPRSVRPPWDDRWAKTDSLLPVPGCQAIGFPAVQGTASGGPDTDQVVGTYRPGVGLSTGRHALVVDGEPPSWPSHNGSPWAGMSGAALHAGGALLGVLTADPEGWQHGRLTVVPLARMLAEPGFLRTLTSRGYPEPTLVRPVGMPHDTGLDFSERYADYMVTRHGSMRIFGISFADRRQAAWPLDAAYYSLEAVATRRWHTVDGLAPPASASAARPGTAATAAGLVDPALATAPMPAEQALASHRRVLLRGVAGSGKTTLAQWLAVTTARQFLLEQIERQMPAGAERARAGSAERPPEENGSDPSPRGDPLRHLRGLRGMVPFLLPLRTIARRGRLPIPDQFLSAVGCPLSPPAGWIDRVMADGRALVLVDGLDEIDERSRERVGHWLRGLIAAFPQGRWLIASRPSAVADSWLADQGFTELTLLPMSRRDIRAFVGRWYSAARETAAGDPAEAQRLTEYERSLLLALHTTRDLGRLATNPLMCGLICALHRDRNGYLPTRRKDLYKSALEMLLNRRDKERDLAPLLEAEPQERLLQRLAYWLVKNGHAEMDRVDALEQLGRALPAIPEAAALGDAETVYRYLLNRSGVLREPTAGTVDFVHRTFQDYLAARAVIEEMDYDLLAANAHQDHWSDVVQMAVAQGRPRECARILRKLVERGDQEPELRARLHLLATASLQHATELNTDEQTVVAARAARLIPPRSLAAAEALAAAGPIVLGLLPDLRTLDEQSAPLVAITAWTIGGEIALPVLSQLAELPSLAVRQVLAQFPQGVTPKVYVREVLVHAVDPMVMIGVRSPEDLLALTRLPGVQRLDLRSPDVIERLDLVVRLTELRELRIGWSSWSPVDLSPLARLRLLRRVECLEQVCNAEMLPGVDVVQISGLD